jgi:hypothetical protein
MKKNNQPQNKQNFTLQDAFSLLVPSRPQVTQGPINQDWLKDLMQPRVQLGQEDLAWINDLSTQSRTANFEDLLEQTQKDFEPMLTASNLPFSGIKESKSELEESNNIGEIKSIFKNIGTLRSSLQKDFMHKNIEDWQELNKLQFQRQTSNISGLYESNPLMDNFINQFNSLFAGKNNEGRVAPLDMNKCKSLVALAKQTYQKDIGKREKKLQKHDYKLLFETGHRKIDGYYALVVQKNDEIVICHRGTDLESKRFNSKFFRQKSVIKETLEESFAYSALETDLQLIRGIVPSHFKIADSILQQIQANNPNAKITHTGHSLGGVIAELLAIKYGQPAVSIDAPGTLGILKLLVADEALPESNIEEYKDNITLFKASPNIINCFGEHFKKPDFTIKFVNKVYEPTFWGFINYTLNQHMIENINEFFENYERIEEWPQNIAQAYNYFLDPIYNQQHWEKYSDVAWQSYKATNSIELSKLSPIELEAKEKLYKAQYLTEQLVLSKKELKTAEEAKFDSISEGFSMIQNVIEKQAAAIQVIFDKHEDVSSLGQTNEVDQGH